LASGPLSNISAGQPALPHKILSSINQGMDVVYEEEDFDRGTTPNKKSAHRSLKKGGGGTSERFKKNTANSNDGGS